MDKSFLWKKRDYNNRSLNSLSKNITEYNTAELFYNKYKVFYEHSPYNDCLSADEGTILPLTELDYYTVADIEVTNFLSDYNIYMNQNTEPLISGIDEFIGKFDCLVTTASGNLPELLPDKIGLKGNHYIVDISSEAIKQSHKHFSMLEKEVTKWEQLDFFNTKNVVDFLKTVNGNVGLFMVSNSFCYIQTSLLYDIKLRLQYQNNFIHALINDKIEWFVDIMTVNGQYFKCVPAVELANYQLSKDFMVLPWI